MQKTKVFIAYAREDEMYLEKLKKHFSSLERNGSVEVWHDGLINSGTPRNEEIKKHLHNADIIMLLVSADLMASDYFWDEQMKDAIARHDRKEAIVVPVILKPYDWEGAPFGKLQVVPKDAKPIIEWQYESKAYLDVIQSIKKNIQTIQDRNSLKEDSTPTFTYLRTIKQIKQDNKTLFENQLAFFTNKEIKNHERLVGHLKDRRAALLLGHPATGKTIAVVDIAERLEREGYTTYYHSFKEGEDRWTEVWKEIVKHANTQTVFVLDDIHLSPNHAKEVSRTLDVVENLNILFISRPIKKQDSTGTPDVYKDLEDYTQQTEQPNIDEKVEGIVKRFQAYYQKNGGNYPIGDFSEITRKVYRNLVVLREYLRFWKELPDLALEQIEDKELYKNIYGEYFDKQDIRESLHVPLLQYLCLYYFEINFHSNREYLDDTENWAKNANHITSEGNLLYSIYHSEYAFLLLKACKAVKQKDFKINYNDNWDDFFFEQIRNYLMSFVNKGEVLENLLELLIAIPRFKKKIQGGVKNSKQIFKKLVEDDKLKEWIKKNCENEDNRRGIALFLFLIIDNSVNSIRYYYEALNINELVFENFSAIGLYVSAYTALNKQSLNDDLTWFEDYHEDYLITIIKSSDLDKISNNLCDFVNVNSEKAKYLYNSMTNESIISDLMNYDDENDIHSICKILIELYPIDNKKTNQIYIELPDEKLHKLLMQARFKNAKKVLRQLEDIGIDKEKTDRLSQMFFDKKLAGIVEQGSFHNLYKDIKQLKDADKDKVKKAYVQFPIQTLCTFLLQGRIQDISNALKHLNKLDVKKTADIYKELPDEKLHERLSQVNISMISHALYQLRDICKEKTKLLYLKLPNRILEERLLKIRFGDIGNILYMLYVVDEEKTKQIYSRLVAKGLYDSILKTKFSRSANSLHQLNILDNTKTKKVYYTLPNQNLINLLSQEEAYRIANSIHQLYAINKDKTKEIYLNFPNDTLIELLLQEPPHRLCPALCQLNTVDKTKTKNIYAEIPNEKIVGPLVQKKIINISQALYQLKDIDKEKTAAIYNDIGNARILSKINEETFVEYRNFIFIIFVFSRLNPKLARELYLELPEEVLFNWDRLKESTSSFNMLTHCLKDAGFTEEDKFLKKLLDMGWNNRNHYLSNNRVQSVGSYINAISDFSGFQPEVIKKRVDSFKHIIIREKNKRHVPRFIATIHGYYPKQAIDVLFEAFRDAYPNEKEAIGYTHFFIAQNYLEKEETDKALPHLQAAEPIFEIIEHEESYEEVQRLIRENY